MSIIYTCRRGKVRYKVTRQLTDHSTFMSPINFPMYIFSKVDTKPYIPTNEVENLDILQKNWKMIRDEALTLDELGLIKTSDKLDDAGFNSFFKKGWSRFYLKWYGASIPSAAKRCPKTTELIESLPNVKAAMFARLKPGSRLGLHRDPFAGSLRYHLGLITPNNDKAYIRVDGEDYVWTDGGDVLFDETYLHEALNHTDQERIILLCDIERPTTNIIATYYNKLVSNILLRSSAAPNEMGDKTGGINKAFKYLYQIRILGKKLKSSNKTLYYIVKYCLFIFLLWLIFW